MNANLAFHAVQGIARTVQPVIVCKTLHSDRYMSPRHVVLIGGNYFEVSSRGLSALRGGITPADLALDPMTDDEIERFGADE